jgi:endonuclease/exonuclease/phosphatase family metal-dependent hydrolase
MSDTPEKVMRFTTWNFNRPSIERAHRLVRFLSSCAWDIVGLQEVSQRAWVVITESGTVASGSCTLDGFGITSQDKLPHGWCYEQSGISYSIHTYAHAHASGRKIMGMLRS